MKHFTRHLLERFIFALAFSFVFVVEISCSCTMAQNAFAPGAKLSGAANARSAGSSRTPGTGTATASTGSASLVDFATAYVEQHPNAKVLGPKSLGGLSNIFTNAGLPIPAIIPASLLNAIGFSSLVPPVPAANTFVSVPSQLDAGILKTYMGMVPTNGNPVTDYESYLHGIVGQMVNNDVQHYPLNAALAARAEQSAQFIAMSNAMGELTKAQSIDAIDYASHYIVTSGVSLRGLSRITLRRA